MKIYKSVAVAINKDYRITIPRRIRNIFKVESGDYIRWKLLGNGSVMISRIGEKMAK